MPGVVSKGQVLAILVVYAITRGVIDELKPVDETSAESAAYDKTAFDATMAVIKAKCECKCHEKGAN